MVVFCCDVECYLCEEKICTNAHRCANSRVIKHCFGEGFSEADRIHMVERKIWCGINETFVDGIHVNILGTYIAQIKGVNVSGYFHVTFHAWRFYFKGKVFGNFEESTTSRYALRF